MSDTVIPKGSLVLVTGANGKYPNITLITIAHILWSGYIGSHIVDILLSQGYQVRGTARSASKLDGLKALWAKKYPQGHFEVAVVEDMAKDGAFDDAVKGSSSLFAFFNIHIDISQVHRASFTPQPSWASLPSSKKSSTPSSTARYLSCAQQPLSLPSLGLC